MIIMIIIIIIITLMGIIHSYAKEVSKHSQQVSPSDAFV